MSLPNPSLRIEPFSISFTSEQLDSLRRDLQNARLPAETYASSQRALQVDAKYYGVTDQWMRTTLQYWKQDFDWKKAEDRLNSVPQFTTMVDDQHLGQFKIHYLAYISNDPNAIPLLLLHGWPGSAHEFTSTIKLLAQSSEKGPNFHIICPNQPGYGYSDGPPLDHSFGMKDVSRILHHLMLGLGFKTYVAQGGDIGSVLARIMCTSYPECLAVNVNYLPLGPASGSWDSDWDSNLTSLESKNAKKQLDFITKGRGYGVMHGTRPATIGIVVQSSPVALLAWLGEKLLEWTDQDPALDTVLEIVTMWWVLETFPKAIYAYAELTSGVGTWHRDPKLYIEKPFGFSSFAHEIASAPQSWARETGNLQWYRYHERGGHFAAMERPDEFAQDMRDCFSHLLKSE